ncbi:adenylate kinase [Lysinibacter sp. HNR]|uniref:adenylate kinase n=1 Tax=Lysinibacter sp. HNR TaxID=3031408 RepID=UPI00243483C0|nr:adenylate kinase [Lysinibacter sp. HNR]WGD36732.1 adenylate kinase [Lysinibacter sp. HNR]
MSVYRLLIIGPPGAGKGTQAALLAKRLGVPAISTGDIFRENIREKTELGVQVKAIVDSGSYVPDELTNKIVADRLAWHDALGGFLLDGYPRTPEQVVELDRILAASGHQLDVVVLLEADTDAVVARLLKRAQEQGRSDDTEEIIRHRQDVYAAQTEPLIKTYDERKLVVRVDGIGTVDEVFARITAVLGLAAVA